MYASYARYYFITFSFLNKRFDKLPNGPIKPFILSYSKLVVNKGAGNYFGSFRDSTRIILSSNKVISSNLFSYLLLFSVFKSKPGIFDKVITSNKGSTNLSIVNTYPKNIFKKYFSLALVPFNQEFRFNVISSFRGSIYYFLEFVSGAKIRININPSIQNYVTFNDRVLAYVISNKLFYFRKKIGQNLFLHDSLTVMFLICYSKDSFFISNWITIIFKKINFFKYKLFIYFIKYLLVVYFFNKFEHFGIFGIKLLLKGKVGVSGNARKRSHCVKVGKSSNFTINYKVSYSYLTHNTFTGVLGLRV